jgi:hypothetical protein
MARRRRTTTTRSGKFDPEDARRVKHTRIGVWDLYEDRQTDIPRVPGSSRLETYAQIVQSMPHVLRMLKDILSIRQCRLLLSVFLVVEVLASLIPAISLWYAPKLYVTFKLSKHLCVGIPDNCCAL